MTVLMNPDCLDQKHRACSGDGWCESTDQAVPCPCVCHQLDQRVQPAPVPLAYLACCGATVTLIRTIEGLFHGRETHAEHCPDNKETP